MSLRVPCDTDGEVIAKLLSDIPHQIGRMLKSVLALGPFLACRWVTSQRQDVPAPTFLCPLQSELHLTLRHIRACQMHHDIKAHILLYITYEFQGDIRGGATRAPCHIDKQGLISAHSLDTIIEVHDAALCPWGKVLKGEEDLVLLDALLDLIGDLGGLSQIGVRMSLVVMGVVVSVMVVMMLVVVSVVAFMAGAGGCCADIAVSVAHGFSNVMGTVGRGKRRRMCRGWTVNTSTQ
mmetsp:Transcript_14240/g.24404  ORF Transcript_14240/g.24404 Transcript_14240/m.24404 type:complete len:236 (+) Transcript_14240:1128-1835(+)